LFVIDEPSAGLHAEDTAAIIETLGALVEEGASVVVVEHDLDIVRAADWVIDLGRRQGRAAERSCGGDAGADRRGESKTASALRQVRRERRASGAKAATASVNAVVVEHSGASTIEVGVVRQFARHLVRHHRADARASPPSPSDVVFAEGQRRFMRAATPYARQFLSCRNRDGMPQTIATTLEYAQQKPEDELQGFRSRFYFPTARAARCFISVGNSLGCTAPGS